jgi:hypothetical protein
MTAGVLERGRARRVLPVPLVLGLQEGTRILRHPISLVGAALMIVVVVAVGDNGPDDAFNALSTGPTFFYGVFTYFAANMVASRDRRAHTGELLAAAPSPGTSRVAGLCAGALVPALACALFVVTVHAMNHARGLYEVAPGLFHLAQGPLTVLGAALLGIMVARLTRIPGAALLVMVAMFAWNIWTSNDGAGGDIHLLGTYVSWAVHAPAPGWTGLYPGSPGWHDAYLLGLCAMAATGAFLREAARPWQVLAPGALLTALTALCAFLQLP